MMALASAWWPWARSWRHRAGPSRRHPLLQTAVIGASVLILGGSEAQKAEWLPKIASGEVTVAVAVDEGTHHAPLNVATEAERNGQGYTLNGAKRYRHRWPSRGHFHHRRPHLW